MKNVYCSLFAASIVLTSIGLVWGQQPPGSTTYDTNGLKSYEPLVVFKPESHTPFVVNPAVADDLLQADNEAAAAKLKKIKQDMTELVTRYPNSAAATELSGILDKAELKVIPGFGVYSKWVFCITVPITR